MAYQNINQYNFRRFGLKPVNEITDICLASDEKDYDQEVIFSPLLIGEYDGNRLPFKFDFNNTGTTLCTLLPCTFEYNTIISENYWNPTNTDPNYCPIITELCDVGLTGIDNGLVNQLSGQTIEINTGLYISPYDVFSRYKYDRRMKMHPITGFTTTQNRLWNDNSYDYNLTYNNDGDPVGFYSKLQGGFFQGFYKISGYDYEIFPERVNLGWTSEIMLRYRWTGDTSVGLNNRYPENKGTFFYMGARAENKFYHYANGHPSQDTGYTRVTSGLTCMHTCGCLRNANTSSNCNEVYQISGGTSSNCSCGCSCNCSVSAEYPEKNPLYDAVSNALSLRLSGDTGNPRLCVKTYTITGGCETTGYCTTGITYTTGTSITEWCSTRGIFDECINTSYVDSEHWVQIDAVFERNEWLDTCDLQFKGGLGLIVSNEYVATLENNSISLVTPPETHNAIYSPETTKIVNFTDPWMEEKRYRLGTLKLYVNGKPFMVVENFEEIIPRLVNVEKEKQIGVGYNISIGGGTQGLHDNLTFSGGCPTSLSAMTYQQDPECLTTNDINNTIYSGLTTNIRLEEIFGGSMIGDVSAFRMYTEPLNASQIKHNYRILKNRYSLLNPDCVVCVSPIISPTSTPAPSCDIDYTKLPTPTPTITSTVTPTITPTVTPTLTPGLEFGPTFTVTNSGASAYTISDGSLIKNNPSLALYRGTTYTFNINASAHPFWIKTQPIKGVNYSYDDGVSPGNGINVGTMTFNVPCDAPDILYYQCQFHQVMNGPIYILGNCPSPTPTTTPNLSPTPTITPTNSPTPSYTPTPTPQISPEAQSFILAAGITDPTQRAAVNQLVIDLQNYNIWDKMKAIYPIVGGTASSHKFNLKNPEDTDEAFRLTFFGGWTHSSNGALPNGTNAYAESYFNPSTQINTDEGCLGIYLRTNESTLSTDIGCLSTNPNPESYYLISSRISDTTYGLPNNSIVPSILTTPNTDSRGFFQAVRTSSSNCYSFKNNISTSGDTYYSSPNVNAYIGAVNVLGIGPNFYSNKQIAFSYFGTLLSLTEANNYYTAVQSFQTSLGRQV